MLSLAGEASAITDLLHLKTRFLPKISFSELNRQTMFPLQSTFLPQDQVTLAASLCIFFTSSSSLLEPDLVLTTDEYRSRRTHLAHSFMVHCLQARHLHSLGTANLPGKCLEVLPPHVFSGVYGDERREHQQIFPPLLKK